MDLNYLRRLVKVYDDSKATEMEIIEDGVTIRLSQKVKVTEVSANSPVYTVSQPILAPTASLATPQIAPNTQNNEQNQEVKTSTFAHEIKAPIVGTFYRAPSPDSPNYVEVGSRVKPGDVLCIIEAMKLMNEIECDISGIVENIVIDNATPVEYNQVLFVIKPV